MIRRADVITVLDGMTIPSVITTLDVRTLLRIIKTLDVIRRLGVDETTVRDDKQLLNRIELSFKVSVFAFKLFFHGAMDASTIVELYVQSVENQGRTEHHVVSTIQKKTKQTNDSDASGNILFMFALFTFPII